MDQEINKINPIDHLDKARKMHDGSYKCSWDNTI